MGHGVFQSVATFVAACGKHVSRASRRLLAPNGNGKTKSDGVGDHPYLDEYYPYDDHQPTKLPRPSLVKTPPRSPLHQVLSRKTSLVPFLGNNNKEEEEEKENRYYDDYWEQGSDPDEEGTPHHGGDEGVWRKNILMGEKCEPLDFSGVIYYDNDGRRLERNAKKSNVDVDVDGSEHARSDEVGNCPSSAASEDRRQHQLQPAIKLPPPPIKSTGSTPRTPPPRSPLHQILNRKASFVPFLAKKKKKAEDDRFYDDWEDESDADDDEATPRGADDDGGVWRKNILMGEKCEPLDFSGVIYYDNAGRRLDHVPPRSPRHPMAGGGNPFPSFTFPVLIDKA